MVYFEVLVPPLQITTPLAPVIFKKKHKHDVLFCLNYHQHHHHYFILHVLLPVLFERMKCGCVL